MDNATLNLLFKTILTCVSVLLTGFLIPWLRSKIDAEKMAKIEEYTTLAVRCAEQLYTAEEWKEKKTYVMDYIINKAEEIGIELTVIDINNLIEGIVNEVKKG